MSAEIIELPVITKLDHPAEFALRKSARVELESAVVVGWRKDGEFHFVSSISDAAEVIFLFEMAKKKLLEIVDSGHDPRDRTA